MTGAEQDQGRAPESTWEFCLSWGTAMIDYVEKAGRTVPTEEWTLTLTEPDRLLVNVLLAAVIYQQASTSALVGEGTNDVALCAPQGRGVTGLLTRQALACVQGVPDQESTERGRAERIVLAEHAGRLDGRDRWERVLRVTCELAAVVARDTAGQRYWEYETPLRAFGAVYRRLLQHRAAADVLGDHDY
ncbi:hypothetical protein DMH18_17620 [Streptomyces sp. WAC 06783]|uniref:hypothetical protein n=1 Tax=Streptomyces sp. WAC 06783 TaxID=2203211 RepID=UPI000F73AFD1|nr:hypothetical protein [Streptomyces sp. WAC 06783]RSO09260.1 hypothetical protein DMH18_17620 [Streptomyces sp. WAC 06783]